MQTLRLELLPETKFALPKHIAEARSILRLFDRVAETQTPFNFSRILNPFAIYFRSSVRCGGRVLQSGSACAALLLADSNEDYVAQVASRRPCTALCSDPSRALRAWQAIASAASFTGSWDMKGGDVDALSSLERTLLKKKIAVNAALCRAPAHRATCCGFSRVWRITLL